MWAAVVQKPIEASTLRGGIAAVLIGGAGWLSQMRVMPLRETLDSAIEV